MDQDDSEYMRGIWAIIKWQNNLMVIITGLTYYCSNIQVIFTLLFNNLCKFINIQLINLNKLRYLIRNIRKS